MRPEADATYRPPLDPAQLAGDPVEQFARWFDEAMGAGLHEPTAMALATADAAGNPSVRIVLLKRFGPEGFEFHTNYESRKGRDLAVRPRAALTLWWPVLHRQVRIEGAAERSAAGRSDAYFRTRTPASRASAAVSPQSRVITDLAELEAKRRALMAEHPDGPPRPAHWGGYVVHPDRIEFWQMGRDRLHDRFLYTRAAGGWTLERLAP